MTGNNDHYRTLEIDSTASREDIRAAYRSLAMRFHPDRNPDLPSAEQRFGEVARAYEVLYDPKKRRVYDSQYVPSSECRGNSSEFQKEADLDRRASMKLHDLMLQRLNLLSRCQALGVSVDRDVAKLRVLMET